MYTRKSIDTANVGANKPLSIGKRRATDIPRRSTYPNTRTNGITAETQLLLITVCGFFVAFIVGVLVVGLIAAIEGNPTTPTLQPTTSPTPQPTTSPTPQPTTIPTTQPTTSPTPLSMPTPQPTRSPIVEPTPEPTNAPTPTPTNQPTDHPTPGPTNQPTEAPTKTPTETPTEPPYIPVPPGIGKCCILVGQEVCGIDTEPVCKEDDTRNIWLSPFSIPCNFDQQDSCEGACCLITGGCEASSYQECYQFGGDIVLEQTCSNVNCTAELGSCCFSDCTLINSTGCLNRPVTHSQCDTIVDQSPAGTSYIYIKDEDCSGCTGACCIDDQCVSFTEYCTCLTINPNAKFVVNASSCTPNPC